MSGENVEELFGEGGRASKPRTGRVVAVLATGLLLTLLGMACTAVPGGLVTLVAWYLIEKEVDRVDSGFLPLEYRPRLVTLRAVVWASLFLVVVLFLVQTVLLFNGVYYALWSAAIELFRPLATEGVPVAPTP